MSSPNISLALELSPSTTMRFSGETDGQGAAAANMSTKRKLIRLFGAEFEGVEDSADDAGETDGQGAAAANMSTRRKPVKVFNCVIGFAEDSADDAGDAVSMIVFVDDNAVQEADDKSNSGLVAMVRSASPHESEARNVSNNGPPAALPDYYEKELTRSDVDQSSRFLVPKEYVRASVLKSRNETLVQACQTKNGTEVVVRDDDTETEHNLTLKRWVTGSFVLTSNWTVEFVKRRGLEAGDLVGLRWDEDASLLHIKLLEKAAASADYPN